MLMPSTVTGLCPGNATQPQRLEEREHVRIFTSQSVPMEQTATDQHGRNEMKVLIEIRGKQEIIFYDNDARRLFDTTTCHQHTDSEPNPHNKRQHNREDIDLHQ
jgi:hypothetical protein